MFTKEINFDRFVRGLILVAGFTLAGWGIHSLSSVLLPFAIAWVLAYMLFPVVRFFQFTCRLRFRILCIFLTLLLVTGMITGLLWLAVPPFIDECSVLKDAIVRYVEQGSHNASIPVVVQEFFRENIRQEDFAQFLNEQDTRQFFENLLPKLGTVIWKTANMIIGLISWGITLLYLIFLLLDYERLSTDWLRFVPRKNRAFARALAADVANGMSGYFRGQALVALLVGIGFAVGFYLIDFPMAIGLGIFIGLLNLVPYLQMVAILPAIALALLKAAETGQNFWVILLGAFVVFLVVQSLQDLVLVPKIMGNIMGLSPAVILLSLSVWGYLLGFLGLIIALPFTTLLLSYYKRYVVREELEEPGSETLPTDSAADSPD